jgi:hypothetical protein
MALLVASYSNSQTDQELIPAVSGRRILVTRCVLSAENLGYFVLLAAPGQPEQTALTPRLYLATSTTADLRFGTDGGVAAPAGQALGLTTVISGVSKQHGLMVWYELVPA